MTEISLDRAVVIVDVEEASYVHYAISEVREQVRSITGHAPQLYHDPADAPRSSTP